MFNVRFRRWNVLHIFNFRVPNVKEPNILNHRTEGGIEDCRRLGSDHKYDI